MKKSTHLILAGVLSAVAIGLPAYAQNAYSSQPTFAENISSYADEVPGIGLISDSIQFDGINISQFKFDNNKKYVFAKPGESLASHMHYKIDASALKTLHLHHLIIGLYDEGPQECILESLGVKNSEGDLSVILKAPEKKGVYQVRFCHSVGLTDHEAKKAWWRGKGPSAKTIVGIVVVK